MHRALTNQNNQKQIQPIRNKPKTTRALAQTRFPALSAGCKILSSSDWLVFFVFVLIGLMYSGGVWLNNSHLNTKRQFANLNDFQTYVE